MLPSCPIEPEEASSRTDPQLAKAEPNNGSGSAFVMTFLRKGKKLLANSSWREE